MTEEEALKDVGSVNEIAVKILNENKLLTKVEKKEKPLKLELMAK